MRSEPTIDRTVLITGATDGIGKGTARALAQRGARLLLHGRNADRLAATRDEIERATDNRRLETYVADFAELDQVRALAEQVSNRHDTLHVLLNNAGVGTVDGSSRDRAVNSQGVEMRFQVNHLAPFLLTRLLLPFLRKGAPARVVNVASIAQKPIDFDDVMLEQGYDGFRAYAQSKLAMIMATIALAERLDSAEVTVNAVHPGSLLDTKMVREGFGAPQGPVEDGIEAELYLATAPELKGVTGRYFDRLQPARPHRQAEDAEARRRLWTLSERLTGLEPTTGPAI